MRAELPDQRRLEKDDLTISCTVTWPLSSAPLTSVKNAAPKNFTSRNKKKRESEQEETSDAHKINSFTFSEWINTNNFASHIHECIPPKLPLYSPQIFLRVDKRRSTLEKQQKVKIFELSFTYKLMPVKTMKNCIQFPAATLLFNVRKLFIFTLNLRKPNFCFSVIKIELLKYL